MEFLEKLENKEEVKIFIPNNKKFLIIPRLIISAILSDQKITLEELENAKLIVSEAINLVLDPYSNNPLSISFCLQENPKPSLNLMIKISTTLSENILESLSKNGLTIHILNYLCNSFLIKQYTKTIEINLIKEIPLVE